MTKFFLHYFTNFRALYQCIIPQNILLQNVIGRCSQPLIGLNGRRSREDEAIMTSFNELRNRTGGFKKGTKAAYFWCAYCFKIGT